METKLPEGKGREEVWQEMVAEINDPLLAEILYRFWEKYSILFKVSPGSSRHHHNYNGGLFDHTYSVYAMAKQITEVYPDLNRDVLLTGAILHDIGKLYSYEPAPLTKTGREPKWKFKRTDDSLVLDHFGEGLLMVQRIVDEIIMDTGEAQCISDVRDVYHIIASHHGDVRRGWGSLVNPNTPEAWVVSECDMISSRVGGDEDGL
jgi:3'-5' exoribonuclease